MVEGDLQRAAGSPSGAQNAVKPRGLHHLDDGLHALAWLACKHATISCTINNADQVYIEASSCKCLGTTDTQRIAAIECVRRNMRQQRGHAPIS